MLKLTSFNFITLVAKHSCSFEMVQVPFIAGKADKYQKPAFHLYTIDECLFEFCKNPLNSFLNGQCCMNMKEILQNNHLNF